MKTGPPDRDPPMPIYESDISLLIPAYRQPEMTRRALACAVATGAGEILVSDDAGGDGMAKAMGELQRDPRVTLFSQPRNLGLWPHHLWLFRRSRLKWIKFLQQDDFLSEGVAPFARAADADVAIVGCLPAHEDLATGVVSVSHDLPAAMRFTSDEYLKRVAWAATELGTPSNTLFRRDALSDDASIWARDVSADMEVNVRAAGHGDVVLLPAGPTLTGVHDARDTSRQGTQLHVRRAAEAIRHLAGSDDPRLRAAARGIAAAEAMVSGRMWFGWARRARRPGLPILRQWLRLAGRTLHPRPPYAVPPLARAARYRYRGYCGFDPAAAERFAAAIAA